MIRCDSAAVIAALAVSLGAALIATLRTIPCPQQVLARHLLLPHHLLLLLPNLQLLLLLLTDTHDTLQVSLTNTLQWE